MREAVCGFFFTCNILRWDASLAGSLEDGFSRERRRRRRERGFFPSDSRGRKNDEKARWCLSVSGKREKRVCLYSAAYFSPTKTWGFPTHFRLSILILLFHSAACFFLLFFLVRPSSFPAPARARLAPRLYLIRKASHLLVVHARGSSKKKK